MRSGRGEGVSLREVVRSLHTSLRLVKSKGQDWRDSVNFMLPSRDRGAAALVLNTQTDRVWLTAAR